MNFIHLTLVTENNNNHAISLRVSEILYVLDGPNGTEIGVREAKGAMLVTESRLEVITAIQNAES